MKLLVISYAPLSLNSNGGKYFMSIVQNFQNDEIVQFYIENKLPDIARCKTYYNNTDMQTLKQRFGGKYRHTIYEKDLENIDYQTSIDNNRFNKIKFRSFKLIIRDIIWKIGKWNTKEFRDWMDKEKPDCILADTGDSSFLYNLVLNISKKYSLPIVCSFGDDYYSLKAKPLDLVDKIRLWSLKKSIKKLITFSNAVITINDKFSQYYCSEFGLTMNKNVYSLCTGSSFDFSNSPKYVCKNVNNLLIGYIGNFGLGRWENLLEIGVALDNYNLEHGTNHVLRINGKDCFEFLKKCQGIKSINYEGFITGRSVKEAILECDILVHTESFNSEYIAQTKFSLSTKIADSLSSGRCLFAYGPNDVASMNHLIENQCAYCITDKSMLYNGLSELLQSPKLIQEYCKKGQVIAKLYHDTKKNSELFNDIICRVVNK